ncbi:Ser-Thr-rich glycosyl-phosphatidyl-inositol-anchored membrane family-domain-containing protein [Xylaria sp. CBS 124048]|nr:Ser-Thr-rich glycosyl-phosphatidyl-inositol-anchored membrane family-domain-containing protein [Xylaria sp. CBS 124048]
MRSAIIVSVAAFAASASAQSAGYAVMSEPTQGSVVPSGQTFNIEWAAGQFSGPATISLLGGSSPTTLQILNAIGHVDVTQGTFAWAVDCSLGTDKTYGIKIADDASGGVVFQYSFPFQIQGPSCGSEPMSTAQAVSQTSAAAATVASSASPASSASSTDANAYPTYSVSSSSSASAVAAAAATSSSSVSAAASVTAAAPDTTCTTSTTVYSTTSCSESTVAPSSSSAVAALASSPSKPSMSAAAVYSGSASYSAFNNFPTLTKGAASFTKVFNTSAPTGFAVAGSQAPTLNPSGVALATGSQIAPGLAGPTGTVTAPKSAPTIPTAGAARNGAALALGVIAVALAL